ncbi:MULTISPECIES: RNA-directed DNA polymerase [unclassified Bradyrhizobium]|uniref:RNA-directed DNA polymerase n=1 Tax=unclassified Bradyrhizobium TaxID=2631580 RepID=UPI001BA6460B|nr:MULTISPECIES: RNA-directed DNA polymerase [unclassified Bradyrhizobium]MBR1201978.1 RNA-directed DNA polymerase [Bradyrhizobium sp. AUGA SZCCT0124]MBR1311453.1 RNA-directed DNA polymerase [Bradyrhizobium sp. AUGA SZCCT0051]MBR1338927.1 RNA-directed DNA polymerase [Bradyrhizobium sp. AUGA SZCCT0105]MBR1353501.1 RNA-directed DNA polymerase [Bradyrhizobium sp. AUGA SZCCT0045]
MSLKQDLLRVGYFPENLPPPFHTEQIAQFYADNPSSYLSDPKQPLRSAIYNASKRGASRRTFSAIHPITAHDLAEFLQLHAPELDKLFASNPSSLSVPTHTPQGERAIEISSHNQLEVERLNRLAGYRFIAKTDISRFYHSIYTHSVSWAFHSRDVAKKTRKFDAKDVYFNRLDFTLRQGQDGQTIGIPVGPDASRYVAELICTSIDTDFHSRFVDAEVGFIRHVDDVWIGAQSHSDVERALWTYRNCLREFELDINESKTRIYGPNFRFTDAWPSDVANRLEVALGAPNHRRDERLRAALEYAFELSLADSDDGILKYAIRQLDRSDHQWDEWATLQPFLMRSAVHFGHTLDYVVRVLVWRKLTKDDLDEERWSRLIRSMLDHHGRLGNDSEVCWLLFAAKLLQVEVPDAIAIAIVRNCGALSIVSVMNFLGYGSKSVFNAIFELINTESADGAMWPVFLEWSSSGWLRNSEVKNLLTNDTLKAMSEKQVFVFDAERLTRVFSGIEESKFSDIAHAIEFRVSSYDAEPEEDVVL